MSSEENGGGNEGEAGRLIEVSDQLLRYGSHKK